MDSIKSVVVKVSAILVGTIVVVSFFGHSDLSFEVLGEYTPAAVDIGFATASATTAGTLLLEANPPIVSQGESSTLSWSTAGMTRCSASGGWSGRKTTSGTFLVSNIAKQTKFSLTCFDGTSNQTTEVIIGVNVATKFNIGERVETVRTSLVRQNAGPRSVVLGYQQVQSAGTVIAGPAATDNIIWWKVDFDTGYDGWVRQSYLSKSVTAPPPVAPPSISFAAQPATINSGQSSTLTWNITDATSCISSDDKGSSSALTSFNGSLSVSPSATTQYTISCSGPGGNRSESTIVTVSTPPPPPTPAPTVSLSASPAMINQGQSTTLSWSSTNATSCTASLGWSGTQPTSGTLVVSPTSDTTYGLTCSGSGGNANQTVFVMVHSPTSSLKVGDRVETTSNVNVRSSAGTNGPLLGTQLLGALGTLTGGPTLISPDHWWNINFDSGVDGWSSENFLKKSTVAPPPPPPPPPPTTSWTFCTNVGAPCVFTGLRDVRLVGANGNFVVQEAFGNIPCAVYGFNGRDPGQAQKCEYGPVKTRNLTNPMPGMGGLNPLTITVPMGDPGASGPRIENTSFTGSPSYDGSFRITCNLAKYDFIDPIVYPGVYGTSHLHMFFGNTGINENSTVQSLRTSGNSTCRGGTLNRTGYWIPAVFDSRDGKIIVPDYATVYYKTGYNVDPVTTQPIPSGLRIIAGNKNNTSGVQYGDLLEVAHWGCNSTYRSNTGAIQKCPAGEKVRLTISFPQCWDGVNLDSANHQSHMAFPNYRNPPQRSTCPASHPVMIPAITEIFDFPVNAGDDPSFWRLSSDMYPSSSAGGFSAHADWMDGWDVGTMDTLVKECLNKAKDCGVGALGNGKILIYP